MNAKAVNDVSKTETATRLGKVIAALSWHLHADRIGSGALAELRRIGDDDLPPKFWLLYLTVVPAEWRERNGKADARHDRAWAVLTRAMVEMGSRPHSFDLSFGTALADTGYSEARFVRLLRAEGKVLARELRVAGGWLARAGVKRVDWTRPASLFRWGPGMRTLPRVARHQLARDYFSATAKQSSNQ